METRTGPFDAILAKALGLKVVQSRHISDRLAIVEMPRLDWRLYDLALNPRSKPSERFIKHAGNPHAFIGTMTLSHLGNHGAFEVFDRLAWQCPHLPHFKEWAERFAPKRA